MKISLADRGSGKFEIAPRTPPLMSPRAKCEQRNLRFLWNQGGETVREFCLIASKAAQ